MRITWGRRLSVATTLVLATFFGVSASGVSAAPASAATTIVCQPINGAPSSEPYNGGIRYYFEVSCNSLAGVTSMVEDDRLFDVNRDQYVNGPDQRGYKQLTVEYNNTYYQGALHGYYQPEMDLSIVGTFAYGSVPGCHRQDQAVNCTWFGQPKYY